MIDKRTPMERLDAANEKCDLLEELGFDINHLDSSVELANLEFDFSAIAPNNKSIVLHAVIRAYEMGLADGEDNTKMKIRSLLGINK